MMPLFRFARFEHHHLGAQHTAERLTVAGHFGAPGPPPPDRAFAVPDQGARHRPQRVDQLPRPANKSSARRDGSKIAESHREYPNTIVSTGSCIGERVCP
jgi:hypothetical protein